MEQHSMNNARRKDVSRVLDRIQNLDIEALIEKATETLEQEQEAFENMPESLQNGAKGETAQEAIEQLEALVEALEGLRDAYDAIDGSDWLEGA